jgi:hypothetical protein
MKVNRRTAYLIGILFIIGTVAGVLSVAATDPIISEPDFVVNLAANEIRWILGTIMVLVMAFSLAMLPAVAYPVLRKENETLALGTIIFRGVLEPVCHIVYVISMLLLLSISRQYARVDGTQMVNIQAWSDLLLALEDWSSLIVTIVFSIGSFMFNYLFFKSRLVPRWLSGWGIIGAVLYFCAPLISMLGLEHLAISLDSKLGFLLGPLALQEMVFAVWMIVKGFNPSKKQAA